eukprot:TRINITY_DN16578_c0_g1_i1.p1 TRINITY_DN16578_c0_g1~~TRINITY_DN16578_c0_g1_i1.p1  ORF type:complete len:691 (+),score=156.50 TRINITY_DN16578_c0_g1_i1:2-2074(+)
MRKREVMVTFQNAAKDKWRVRKDQHLCASSLGCLALMVVQNILIWRFALSGNHDDRRIMVSSKEHPTLYIVIWVINGVMIFLTLLSVIFLTQHYHQTYRLKSETYHTHTNHMPPNVPKLLCHYLLEVAIQFIYPYPFLSRATFLYQILLIGMFLRLYIVFRVLHTGSHAFRRRAQIRSQYQDFRRMDLKISWDLTIKMAFYKYMWAMVTLSTVLIIFVLAFCLYVLERESDDKQGLHSGFSDLGGCLWFSFVTFTTIGYGDMVPKSTAGKIVTVILGTLGHVVIATFGGVVTNKLTPTKTQQLMTEYIENQDAEVNYKRAAATLIQSVWRLWSAKKKSPSQLLRTKEGRKARQRNRELVQIAVKRFMQRRYQLAKSSLQAIDPVIDQKLDAMNLVLEAHTDVLNRLVAHLDAGSPLASTQNTKHSNNLFSSWGSRNKTLFRKGSARRSNSITGLYMACERPQTPLGSSLRDPNPALDITPAPKLGSPPDPASRQKKKDRMHLSVEAESFADFMRLPSFVDAMRLPSNATLPIFESTEGEGRGMEGDRRDTDLDTEEDSSRNTRSTGDNILAVQVSDLAKNPLALNVPFGKVDKENGLTRSPRMQGTKWKEEVRMASSNSVNSASSGGTRNSGPTRPSLPSRIQSHGDPLAYVPLSSLEVSLRSDTTPISEHPKQLHQVLTPKHRKCASDL